MAGITITEKTHVSNQFQSAASCNRSEPNSLSQEVGCGLGAKGGEKLAEVCSEAGFTQIRLAAQTPTNMVLKLTDDANSNVLSLMNEGPAVSHEFPLSIEMVFGANSQLAAHFRSYKKPIRTSAFHNVVAIQWVQTAHRKRTLIVSTIDARA